MCEIYQNGRRGTFEEDLDGKMHFAWQAQYAVQETCPSEMLGGQGTDFLTGVAF